MIIKAALLTSIILSSFIFVFSQTETPKIVRPKKVTAKIPIASVEKQTYQVPMIKVAGDAEKPQTVITTLPGISAEALLRKNEEGKTSIAVEFAHDSEAAEKGIAILWIVTKAGMYSKVGAIPPPNEKNISAMVTSVELEELGLLVTIEPEPTEQPKGKTYGAFKTKE